MSDEIYDFLEGMSLDRNKTFTFSWPYFMGREDFLDTYEESTGKEIEAGQNTFSRNMTGRFEFSSRKPQAYIKLDPESREHLKDIRENYRKAGIEAYVRYALEEDFDEVDLAVEAKDD